MAKDLGAGKKLSLRKKTTSEIDRKRKLSGGCYIFTTVGAGTFIPCQLSPQETVMPKKDNFWVVKERGVNVWHGSSE